MCSPTSSTPTIPSLRAMTDRIRSSRLDRARIMADRIARDYDLDWDDIVAQTSDGATVGRPHIADALVARGLVRDRAEAFSSILSPRGDYYVALYAPDPVTAVELVVGAGGVAIIAHPAGRAGLLPMPLLDRMLAAGLGGFELGHRENLESRHPHPPAPGRASATSSSPARATTTGSASPTSPARTRPTTTWSRASSTAATGHRAGLPLSGIRGSRLASTDAAAHPPRAADRRRGAPVPRGRTGERRAGAARRGRRVPAQAGVGVPVRRLAARRHRRRAALVPRRRGARAERLPDARGHRDPGRS